MTTKNIALFACTALILSVMAAITIAYAPDPTTTKPVTASQLMYYRGLDVDHGNQVMSIHLHDSSKEGHLPGLLLGLKMESEVQPVEVQRWTTEIRPGPTRATYELVERDKTLYERDVEDPLNKPWTGDARGFHKMTPSELLNSKLVRGVELQLDQTAYDRAFNDAH
jgi:hypothetical protein